MTPSCDNNVLEKLPNEVVAMILSSLPRKHLKQARLVSRRLAELGVRDLIDTVYISSRGKDMAVFDSITKHPVFSKSVKIIVFDNAQFDNLSMSDYFKYPCQQLSQPQFCRLMNSNLALRNLLRLMIGEPFWPVISRLPVEASVSALERCQHDEVFFEGYKLYSAHVREQDNILDIAWFARALDGFNRLGSIEPVILGTTFNQTFFVYDCDYEHEALGDNDKSSVDEEVDKGTASDIQLALAHFEGRSLTGSPVARTWPPTALFPEPPSYHHRSGTRQALRGSEISNGCVEFLKLTQLLRRASKQPLRFDVEGGVPPYVFDSNNLPGPANLQVFSHRLKILNLTIIFFRGPLGLKGDTVRWHPQLHTFKSLMRNIPTLEDLQLIIPFVYSEYGSSMYDFSQVFPAVTEWRLPKLRRLVLMGLSFSYTELAGFLFLVLPKLEILFLGDLLLKDGGWNDFVEWFRQYRTPSICHLDNNFLYPENRAYYKLGKGPEVASRKLPVFYKSVANYIMKGGRHPGLRKEQHNSDSKKFLAKMKATIEELRAASSCSKGL